MDNSYSPKGQTVLVVGGNNRVTLRELEMRFKAERQEKIKNEAIDSNEFEKKQNTKKIK